MSIEQIDIINLQIRDIQSVISQLKKLQSNELRTRAIIKLEEVYRRKRRELTTLIHQHAETIRPNPNRYPEKDRCPWVDTGQPETRNYRGSETARIESDELRDIRPTRASQARRVGGAV